MKVTLSHSDFIDFVRPCIFVNRLDGVSRPPSSEDILRRLVADEMLVTGNRVVNLPALARRLAAELPHEVEREAVEAAILQQATTLGLAVEFDSPAEQDRPSRD